MYNIIKALQILLYLFHSKQQTERLSEEILLTTSAVNKEIHFIIIFYSFHLF